MHVPLDQLFRLISLEEANDISDGGNIGWMVGQPSATISNSRSLAAEPNQFFYKTGFFRLTGSPRQRIKRPLSIYLHKYCLFGMKKIIIFSRGPLWTFDGSLES